MNSQQAEKIKSLIASSPILSPQERAEWLQLLELMDDKQLAELEKILGNRKQESGSMNYESGSRKPDSQGLVKKQAPISAPAPDLRQKPRLSHIVNLPNNFEQKTGNAAPRPFFPLKQGVAVPTASAATVKEKQDSKFLGKLKSIFSEKELTAGKPESPLELAEGKQAPAGQSQTAAPSRPALPQQPAIIPPKLKVPPPAAAIPAQLNKQLKIKTAAPAFSAGINFPQASEKQKSEIASGLKSSAEEKKYIPQPATAKAATPKEAIFKAPGDLASFDINIFESSDLDSLVKKIKALVSGFGYFEVIFNIEKSPMFKNYVSTGLKALSEEADFDSLSPSSEPGRYLDRGQFEKFTDLLTKIQTS